MKLTIESTISPNQFIRKRRKEQIQTEGLTNFEIGKCYSDFNMIESFIEEYDADLTSVKIGDILVRDWQYGHLPNTGYRPIEVVDIPDNTHIIVNDATGRSYSICTDTMLMKDRVYHKLNKSFLLK